MATGSAGCAFATIGYVACMKVVADGCSAQYGALVAAATVAHMVWIAGCWADYEDCKKCK